MANAVRGEVELKLGGKTYTLRPTFEALCEIESRLGMGIVELVTRVPRNRLALRHAAVVAHEGARAGGHDDDLETIGAAITEAGLQNVMEPLVRFLLSGIAGGEGKKTEAPAGEAAAE